MFVLKLKPKIYSRIVNKMHTSNSCKNLCFVLRKCLAEEPDIEKIEEQTVSVRSVDGEEKLQITTRIHGAHQNYLRKKEEPIKNTFNRIHLNLTNQHSKKKAKKLLKQGNFNENNGFVHFYPNDVKIEIQRISSSQKVALDLEVSNLDAWREENVLKIGEDEFKIRVNAPAVTAAKMPSVLMAGYPVVPIIDLEFAERHKCKFMWFRAACKPSKHENAKIDKKAQYTIEKCCDVNMAWEFLSDTFKFIPGNNDIGYKLKFVCIPRRGDIFGFSHEVVSSSVVEAGPGMCPFEERHLYTNKATEGPEKLRVVSYNILADIYANTEVARDLMYSYCSSYAMEFDYRGQLILKELIGYNSDIICLQECDMKIFDNFMEPSMKEEGYEGHFLRKAGEMPEGEAIFYRESRFLSIKKSDVIIGEALNLQCNTDILKAMEKCPELLESLQKRTAVGQVIALRDVMVKDRVICILNTHLYFRPEATNIRLLQMAILINHFNEFVASIKSEFCDVQHVAPLICGDFNSTPERAVIEFLMEGTIDKGHPVWKEESQEQPDINLEHNFTFFSACGYPKFTNYVVGFRGTLDYIIPGKTDFEIDSCIPLPAEDILKLHTALPSVTVPSDHLALVCDLVWHK